MGARTAPGGGASRAAPARRRRPRDQRRARGRPRASRRRTAARRAARVSWSPRELPPLCNGPSGRGLQALRSGEADVGHVRRALLRPGDQFAASLRRAELLEVVAPHDRRDLLAGQRLVAQQRLGERVERRAVAFDDLARALVLWLADRADLAVDQSAGLFAEVRRDGVLLAEEAVLLVGGVADRADRAAHAQLADHHLGEVGRLLDVVLRAGG